MTLDSEILLFLSEGKKKKTTKREFRLLKEIRLCPSWSQVRSGVGVRGRERERTRVLAVYFPYGASKVHLFLSRFVLFTLQAL